MSERREWIGYWGKHMKAAAFRNIQPHQKVNHFPGTFEIGRKDKLWKNLNKAQIKHSKKVFSLIFTSPIPSSCIPSFVTMEKCSEIPLTKDRVAM
jgi:tubulin polyglutamylase TTLL4